MLDQLVESKISTGVDKTRGGLLFTTSVLIFSVFLGGLLWSLFGLNVGVGGEGLELSTLVAPVELPEEKPPEPEKEKKAQKPDVDTRKQIIRNINESPVKPPKKTSVVKSKIRERRQFVDTAIGSSDSDSGTVNRARPTRVVDDATGIGGNPGPAKKAPEPKKSGPPPPPPPPPAAKKIPKRISGGVVNGRAISLPKPPYPAAARAVRAKGRVSVSVVISKTGRVISASARGGHPLLRRAAVSAARRARFRPTKLSGVPVEVTGVIVYNFKP